MSSSIKLPSRVWKTIETLEDLLHELELADYLVLAAIVLLPWAFGGVEIWAYRAATLLIFIAAASRVRRHGLAGLGLGRRSLWMWPAFGLALWAAIQIVPLPPGVIGALSPEADAIYRQTFPGYPDVPDDEVAAIEAMALSHVPEVDGLPEPERQPSPFGTELGGRWDGWRTLSLLPQAGLERLAWYLALLLAFLIVRERVRDPDVAHHYRTAMFGCFVGLALFGLIYAATGNGKLYWVRPTRDLAFPFGPYVNPTNFAAVMEMAAPWLLGYALLVSARMGIGVRGLLRTPIFAVGAVLCVAAGFATASKFAALALAISVSLLLLIAARGLWQRLAVLGGLVVVWGGGALVLLQTHLGERVDRFLDTMAGYESIDRFVVSDAAIPMLRDYLLVGSGFGSFREVFGRYMPAGEYRVWKQLHNDYLELLLEGGLVAGVLVLLLLAGFLFKVLRPSNFRTETGRDLEAIGVLLGVGALMVHAVIDFNHQIPANALLFVSMAAWLVARSERGHTPVEAPARPRSQSLVVRVALAALVAVFAVRAGYGVVGGYAYSQASRLASDGNFFEAQRYLQWAVSGNDPAALHWLRAQVRHGRWELMIDEVGPTALSDRLLRHTFRDYARAIATSPASGWYWADVGEVYHDLERQEAANTPVPLELLGADPWALVGRPGRVAVGMCRIGIAREPNLYNLYDRLAVVLLERDLVDAALEAVRGSARIQPMYYLHPYRDLQPTPPEVVEAFADASREALGQTPLLRTGLHLTALGRIEIQRGNYTQAAADLRQALEQPAHQLNLAETNYYLGVALMELEEYSEARERLEMARIHPNMEVRSLATEAVLTERAGDLEAALELLRALRRQAPRDLTYILQFARIARRLELWDQAEDALKWGRLIFPEDVRPRRELITLYVDRGDLTSANRIWNELLAELGETDEVIRLRAAILSARE